MNIRVAIISDIRLYREGLANALDKEEQFEVCGIYEFNTNLLTFISLQQPDMFLVDTTEHTTSLDIIRKLHSNIPNCVILALALKETETQVITYIEAGCSSYVSRNASLADLIDVVLRTYSGELVCPPKIAGSLLRYLKNNQKLKSPQESYRVTNRELQIVKLIDNGLSNKEIAKQLSIEVSTVKNHVHSVLEKLNVARRNQAAARLRHLF